MKITLSQWVGMKLRKAPVRSIRRALKTLRAAGVESVSVTDLENQALAGGDPERVAKAMARAKELEVIAATFPAVAAIDLAGRNPIRSVEEAGQLRRVRIETVGPNGDRALHATTRTGERVRAAIEVSYFLPLTAAGYRRFDRVPEHLCLTAHLLATLTDARDLRDLQRRCDAIAEDLVARLDPELATIQRLSLEFTAGE